MIGDLVQLAYLIATALFVFALHWMNAPATARRGVFAGVAAHGDRRRRHLAAARGSCTTAGSSSRSSAGFAVGVPLSRVPLTAVPQRTALSHAFGGLAAGLVGTAKYYLWLGEGPENLTAFRMVAIIVEIILGFLTFTGQPDGGRQAAGGEVDPAAAGDLSAARTSSNLGLLADRRRRAASPSSASDRRAGRRTLFPRDHRARAALRRAADHPDRRRRHADRHRDPELLRRPLRGGDGLRARQQAAHHRRRARRVERPHPVDHHVQGDEPLVHQRAVRGVRPGPAGQAAGGEQKVYKAETAEGARPDAGAGQLGRDHPRLRHGRGAGAAPGPRAVRPAQEARHQREVRHPSRGRPHAGTHERAARRGGHPVRPTWSRWTTSIPTCRRPTSRS